MNYKVAEPYIARMDLRETVEDRSRLARVLLAVVLAGLAVRSVRNGKRARGLLAAGGAVALGYTATSESRDLNDVIDFETDDDYQLRCAHCGEPIVPGQRRGPNANDEIVHETCLEPSP